MNTPRVSIGLPVYNGARYLATALDSLLAQTYTDFELIISDNASTDDTEAIARAYAARDGRIRYYRNDRNLGGSANFNRVLELARGEYFRSAAHDDTCAPEYLAKCVAALDHDPDLVLCHTRTIRQTPEGQALPNPVQEQFDAIMERQNAGSTASERFDVLINLLHGCYQSDAVMRTQAVRLTEGLPPYTSSDRVMLARLALIGPFHQIPEYLFFSLDHPDQSIRAFPRRAQRYVWNDPKNEGKIVFPQWRLFYEYLRAVWEARVSLRERLLCYLHLGRWVVQLLNLSRFAKDLVVAGLTLTRKWFKPMGPTPAHRK